MIPRSESFENDFQQWIILKRSKGHPRSDKAFEMTRFSLLPTECLFFLVCSLQFTRYHGWTLIFSRNSLRIFARNKFWIGERVEFVLFQFFSTLEILRCSLLTKNLLNSETRKVVCHVNQRCATQSKSTSEKNKGTDSNREAQIIDNQSGEKLEWNKFNAFADAEFFAGENPERISWQDQSSAVISGKLKRANQKK